MKKKLLIMIMVIMLNVGCYEPIAVEESESKAPDTYSHYFIRTSTGTVSVYSISQRKNVNLTYDEYKCCYCGLCYDTRYEVTQGNQYYRTESYYSASKSSALAKNPNCVPH